MKVLTVVGARPQFIKEALLSAELLKRQNLDEVLVHTGQHHDSNMSEVFFNDLGIPRPDYNLGISGGTHASMTGRIMESLEGVLEHENPDIVVVYGDTNSTLAGALTAVKMHFPVCHAESGVRTGYLTNPEEVNRLCTDHISSLNCAPTPICYKNLLLENLGKSALFTGDLMFDAYKRYSLAAKQGSCQLLDLSNNEIKIPENLYYLTCHREENSNSASIAEILLAMEELDYPAIYPVHPRMRKLVTKVIEDLDTKNTIPIQPVGYLESLSLLNKAVQVITDSGGIQREAFFAGKKCVTLLPFPASDELLTGNRSTLLEEVKKKTILAAMNLGQTIDPSYMPFGDGSAAEKIVDEIEEFFEKGRS